VIRTRARRLLVGVVCGLAAAAASRGQALRFLQPASGARFGPGTPVSVSWSAGLAAEPDVAEMELVLSLDGGASFPLRVTQTLSPDARSYSWRVPALPTAHARLALRSGRGGEKETEVIRTESAEFVIVAGPEASLEEIFRVRGEWRTREALESSADPPEPSAFRLAEEEVRAAFGSDRPAEPPTTTSVAPDRGRRDVLSFVASPVNESVPAPPDSNPPSIPLRQ